MRNWWPFVFVAVGGTFGAAARHLIGDAGDSGEFPLATLGINITGALLLGFLLERSGAERLRLLVGTGFLGGFTTYSTLAVDTDLLLRGDQLGLAAAYALGTVGVGLVASVAGMALGRRRIAQ